MSEKSWENDSQEATPEADLVREDLMNDWAHGVFHNDPATSFEGKPVDRKALVIQGAKEAGVDPEIALRKSGLKRSFR